MMMKRSIILIVTVLTALGWSSAVKAENEDLTRRISFKDVTELALINNFDIQLVKYDILISRLQEDAVKSIYDTMVSARSSYVDDRLAKSSLFLGERVITREFDLGLSKSLPSGTTLSAGQTLGRERISGDTALFDSSYRAETRLTLAQDLGRNFFGVRDRGLVKIARKDVENAEYFSFDRIEQSLADAQKTYWQLVLLYEIDRINQEMMDQAQRLYNLDQERYKHGLVETPQLLGSEANLQIRRADLFLSKSAVLSGINLMKLLLNIDNSHILLQPEDGFVFSEQPLSLVESMNTALNNRQDYKMAMNDVRRQNIVLEVARYGAWPEVQLQASFSRNGLADSYGDALSDVGDENNREFLASLLVSMPLENRAAQAEIKEAEYRKARALVNVKYVERRIAVEIADQIAACESATERLLFLEKAAELQARKAQEQEKVFGLGRSDSDTVIRFQEDALNARVQSVQAHYDYFTSLIELKRREGVLLKEYWDGEI
jgi:outer membrane protein TolC